MSRPYVISSPPRINRTKVAIDEHDIAAGIDLNLQNIETCVRRFEAALTLFDYCSQSVAAHNIRFTQAMKSGNLANLEKMPDFHSWMMIAGRDGASTLYQAKLAIVTTKLVTLTSGGLRKAIGKRPFTDVENLFKGYFPESERIRHAASHFGEMTSTTRKRKKNSFSRDYAGHGLEISGTEELIVEEFFHGRVYAATHEGDIVSYELSEKSLVKLAEVQYGIYSIFLDYFEDWPPFP